jgi:putative PepSY-like beta-lactamase-inhibitor
MKKLMGMLVAATSFTFAACSQKLDASKVPANVKAFFAKEYPGVNPKWEKEDGNYEATFKKDGRDVSLIISPAAIILETEVDIKTAELPAAVLGYIKEHYAGKSIKEASKIMKGDHTVNYEARINGRDVIFDEAGKFIKEEKD